jgi:hypothetical protein
VSFKELDQSTDVSTQLSVVNEIIPLTGTFFSGSPNSFVKTYENIASGSAVSGGFWETIYDGAPTSVSASALVDLTYGQSSGSVKAQYSETFLNAEKQRVYREMAQLLLGDAGALFSYNNVVHHDLFFIALKRRIYKDEVKKGNVSIALQVDGVGKTLSLTDTGAASAFVVGPAGDEADLFSGSTAIGRVYYNAGIIAFATGVFMAPTDSDNVYWSGSAATAAHNVLEGVAVTGSIDSVVDGLRNRINQLDFQNQTNLHSTIYFCRALNADFNYSTNPTFLDGEGRIIPTSGTDNQTRTYITTIGLYDINDNLLAVAKTSEPVKKSPDNEVVFRVRLSY